MQLQTLEAQALMIGWIVEKCNIRQYRYALHSRDGKQNGFLFRTLAELEKVLHQLDH